jgi:DNA-binding NtrC family response regulator
VACQSGIGPASVARGGSAVERLTGTKVTSERPETPVRLLVMDDEYCIRDITRELLSGAGYQVDSVNNGEEAVFRYDEAMMLGTPYQAVILDLIVPCGSGAISALSSLREIDPEVKAIVTSGYHDAPAMSHPLQHGFCASLPKPFEKEELCNLICRVLGATANVTSKS